VKDMTIKVMDKDSIFIVGAISQKNGWFEVNNIKLSSVYLIECSGIGYERTIQKIKGRNTVDVSTLNADTIFVASSPYNLKEVVVKGESRKRQIDRIVIYPTLNPQHFN
jgi:predicted metal-binding protein